MTDSRRLLPLLLIVLPLAVALGWWLRPVTAPIADGDAAEVASLQQQLARQRQETDARLARIERLLADRAGDAAPAPDAPADIAAREVQVRQRTIANSERLAQAFSGGAAGPRAADAEKRVQAAIASPLLRELTDQPLSTEVQCRARMCAIRVVFPAGTDAEAWTTQLSMALAPHYGRGRVAVMQTAHGDVEATLYTVPPGNESLLDLR
jgi:hypothetical protein